MDNLNYTLHGQKERAFAGAGKGGISYSGIKRKGGISHGCAVPLPSVTVSNARSKWPSRPLF